MTVALLKDDHLTALLYPKGSGMGELDNVTIADRNIADKIETHREQALWYAWGWLDAKGISPSVGIGFHFADHYAKLRAQFETGRHFTAPSILGEWESWRKAHGMD